MVKEEKPEDEKTTEERMKELKGKVRKKTEVNQEEFAKQLATRSKLERDYEEDIIKVTFNSSPETRRTIQARRPNKREFLEILSLSIQASKFEGLGDAKSLENLGEIYTGLHQVAAKLSVDKTLDEKFWETKVSFVTLQNFIGEVMNEAQRGVGGVTEDELKNFRRK